MALREEFERQGEFLFRWRSYLPILILPVLILALPHSGYGQRILGREFDLFVELFSMAVALSGVGIRCLTIGYVTSGTSGRNTKRQKAVVLNTTGMYSVVRHPLYLGNFIVSVGVLLFVQVWWFALIGVLAFWLYYERIMLREEEFLRDRFGPIYLKWSNETPAFLPRFRAWRPPARRFSWRTVLRREYTAFLWVTAVFASIDVVQDVVVMGERALDWTFVGLGSTGLAVYLVLRTLKRQTKLLNAEGADSTRLGQFGSATKDDTICTP